MYTTHFRVSYDIFPVYICIHLIPSTFLHLKDKNRNIILMENPIDFYNIYT